MELQNNKHFPDVKLLVLNNEQNMPLQQERACLQERIELGYLWVLAPSV